MICFFEKLQTDFSHEADVVVNTFDSYYERFTVLGKMFVIQSLEKHLRVPNITVFVKGEVEKHGKE